MRHVAVISSFEDTSSVFFKGRADLSAMADIIAMQESIDITALRQRLEGAVQQSGRSMRSISLDAGVGPGYLHSILVEGKEPRLLRLARVCDVMNVSLLNILYGVDISPETTDIIQRLERNPSKRDGILALLDD